MNSRWLAGALVLGLVGCSSGGGGGAACDLLSDASCAANNTPRPPVVPQDPDDEDNEVIAPALEGLFTGSSSSNRKVEGLVLDDGTLWFLYYTNAEGTDLAGFVQGTTLSDGITFTGSGSDFDILQSEAIDFTLSGSFMPRSSIDGVIEYVDDQEVSLLMTYDQDYELTPALGSVAGTYVGKAVTSGGTETVTMTISGDGTIFGQGASSCTFAGNVEPRARGNVYNFAVGFNGGACALGTVSVNGVAYLDASTNTLLSAALSANQANGFLFRAARQ